MPVPRARRRRAAAGSYPVQCSRAAFFIRAGPASPSRKMISFETSPRSTPPVFPDRKARAEQLVASFIGASGCPTATALQSCCLASRRKCSHDSRSARLSQGKYLEKFRRLFWCPTHCHRLLAAWPLLAPPLWPLCSVPPTNRPTLGAVNCRDGSSLRASPRRSGDATFAASSWREHSMPVH